MVMQMVAFRRDRYDRVVGLDSWHFWFVARRERVANLVARHAGDARRVVDVGCGSGRLVHAVAPPDAQVVAIDRHLPATGTPARGRVAADSSQLPLATGSVDLVLALDMLEHVDDETAMAEIRRILRPGGRLVVTVPAFSWLWSFRDVDAGHRRRYTRNHAVALLRRHGFDMSLASYYMAVLFPLVLLMRLLGRRWPGARDAEEVPGALLNAVLLRLLRFENRLAAAGMPVPVGSSIVLVGVAA